MYKEDLSNIFNKAYLFLFELLIIISVHLVFYYIFPMYQYIRAKNVYLFIYTSIYLFFNLYNDFILSIFWSIISLKIPI